MVEKAGKKLIDDCVNAVGCGGQIAHKDAAESGGFAELDVDGVIGRSGGAGAARDHGAGDSREIDSVGAGEPSVAVVLCLKGVDADDEISSCAQRGDEVRDIRGLVFATDEDMFFGNVAAAGRGFNLLDEEIDSLGVVADGKRSFENVAVAVAAQC